MNRVREYPNEWLRLTTRWGDELYDPSEVQLQESLIELADPDVDNEALPSWEREASLAWRDGTHIWFIAAFTDGSVVFGEAESGTEYVLPHPVAHERVMDLWYLLRDHQLDQIWRESWQPRSYEHA